MTEKQELKVRMFELALLYTGSNKRADLGSPSWELSQEEVRLLRIKEIADRIESLILDRPDRS